MCLCSGFRTQSADCWWYQAYAALVKCHGQCKQQRPGISSVWIAILYALWWCKHNIRSPLLLVDMECEAAGDWAEGNMWSCSAFSDHLDASCAQKGLWHNHIQPQMQRIVQYSLACATVPLPSTLLASALSQTHCQQWPYCHSGSVRAKYKLF